MTAISLERQVGRLTFERPVIVGAGVCKTHEQVRKALASDAGGCEIGSITAPPRPGNSGNNFYAHYEKGVLLYTLNSLGMPNPGKEAVSMWASDAIHEAHDRHKRIGMNIAADTSAEIVNMVEWSLNCGFDWTTINAGCPNKWKLIDGISTPQSILSFSLDGTAELMELLKMRIGIHDSEVWWKPSPDNNTLGTQLESFKLIAECPTITGTVLNNTAPHCLAYDEGKRSIDAGGGLAGMGGPAVKPKAMGDLVRLQSIYSDRFNWIGAGGATYGKDIGDYLRINADIVQCTSALLAVGEDYDIFGTMHADFCEQEGISF